MVFGRQAPPPPSMRSRRAAVDTGVLYRPLTDKKDYFRPNVKIHPDSPKAAISAAPGESFTSRSFLVMN